MEISEIQSNNTINEELLLNTLKFESSLKFFKIYFIENNDIEHLITLCYNQNLTSIYLRSLIWKIFLNLLPMTKDKLFRSWLITSQAQREEFFLLKE